MKRLVLIILLVLVGPVWASTDVYCAYCQRHLYTYTDEIKDSGSINPSKFEPIDPLAVSPLALRRLEDFKCPYDDAPLNGYLYWAWQIQVNEPRLVYKALTIYTKDKEGNFYWYPDKVAVR